MRRSDQDDLNLWRKVRRGDLAAFDSLYSNFVQPLYNYGIKINPDQQLVQDCIQEVFIQIWKNKQKLKIERSLKHYLYLSLRRLIIRKEQKLKPLSLDPSQLEINYLPSVLGEEVVAQQKKKILEIKKLMQCLPKRQYEAIYLKYFERMQYDEIATIMSIQVPAVYKLVSAGIKKLREYQK